MIIKVRVPRTGPPGLCAIRNLIPIITVIVFKHNNYCFMPTCVNKYFSRSAVYSSSRPNAYWTQFKEWFLVSLC